MKIAILTELFPPHVGGQEIRFSELADVLAAKGHEVEVFTIACPASAPRTESRGNIRIQRYPASDRYSSPLVPAFRRRLLPLLRYSLRVRRVLQQDTFDLCILNEFPLLHVLLAPRRLAHTYLIDWCEVRNGFPFGWIQRRLPRRARFNMAVSSSVRDHIQQTAGTRVAYVPSGVHCALYGSSPGEQRSGLLYIGRITEHKNLPLLLDAYSLLRQTGFREPLLIAGDGPAMQALRERQKREPLEGLQLLGRVTDQQKIALLRDASLLVIPSKREGFPRVIAEAMASGLPVLTVAYPENGSAAVVREYDIGLSTEPSPAALADGVLAMQRSWSRFSAAALTRAPELDWDRVADHMLSYVQNGVRP